MLKKILIGLVLVVGGVLVFAATRPDTYHVERTAKIDAPATVVFSQLEDFKAWAAWSPWDKLDPQMKKTYEGPPVGVGSTYSWQGNDKVGKGKMSIVGSQPPTEIKYRLEFIEPFTAIASTGFKVAAEGDKASVTWSMDGNKNLMAKVFGLFKDMDAQIGSDFDKGLAGLKAVAESESKKRAEAEAAKKQADAAAAAKAEQDAAAAKAAAEAVASKEKGKGKKAKP
jgi:hypothetical protein